MKIIALTVGLWVLWLSTPVGMAQVILFVDPAPDNKDARVQIWETKENKAEIAAAREEHWAFCGDLRSVGEGAFDALFGKASDVVPSGYSIPVFAHPVAAFSGNGYRGEHRSRFYAISDVGGVLMFPLGDGQFVSAVVIYLKIDDKFTAVRSTADYRARMDWDAAKLKLLRSWVQDQAKRQKIDLPKKKP